MEFTAWLINQLAIYNQSGIESDFPIDYQKLLCVIEEAEYPDYNFLVQLIEFLGLDEAAINEMISLVSEDLKIPADEIYGRILIEIEAMKENGVCLKRSVE